MYDIVTVAQISPAVIQHSVAAALVGAAARNKIGCKRSNAVASSNTRAALGFRQRYVSSPTRRRG